MKRVVRIMPKFRNADSEEEKLELEAQGYGVLHKWSNSQGEGGWMMKFKEEKYAPGNGRIKRR